MSRRRTSAVSLTTAILFLLIGYFFKSPPEKLLSILASPTPSPRRMLSPMPSTIHRVTEVIDGDTIKIDTGQKVRYIGIDTPEIHEQKNKSTCFGQEAKQKNEELVGGKLIAMSRDVSEVDRYGRLLRYIYLYDEVASKEGTFVNDYLVREGYARAATFPPDVSRSKEFIARQEEARQAHKGLWSACNE